MYYNIQVMALGMLKKRLWNRVLPASNHPEVVIGTAQTTIIAPQIGTVTKEAVVLGGGLAAPGASLVYTISLPNIGAVALSGVQRVAEVQQQHH